MNALTRSRVPIEKAGNVYHPHLCVIRGHTREKEIRRSTLPSDAHRKATQRADLLSTCRAATVDTKEQAVLDRGGLRSLVSLTRRKETYQPYF